MNTDAIAPFAAVAMPQMLVPPIASTAISTTQAGASTGAAQPGFGDLVTQGLESVNSQLMASQADLQNLALGNAQNLHQIMIKLEESRLSFQLAMQVRSRVLEAYQDVMKMQI